MFSERSKRPKTYIAHVGENMICPILERFCDHVIRQLIHLNERSKNVTGRTFPC